jgi:DNA-binding PadR family transcriptional regulator
MTNAELAILSLIVEAPRHGYELDQVIEERGMRNWTEVGFSSIYYLLKKMEDKELITSHMEQIEGRGPARKVYLPTEKGKSACREATIRALETPHRCFPPILLGISNLESLSISEAMGALFRHLEGLEERLDELEERWMRQQPLPPVVEALFDYSTAEIKARMEWIETYMNRLKEEQP